MQQADRVYKKNSVGIEMKREICMHQGLKSSDANRVSHSTSSSARRYCERALNNVVVRNACFPPGDATRPKITRCIRSRYTCVPEPHAFLRSSKLVLAQFWPVFCRLVCTIFRSISQRLVIHIIARNFFCKTINKSTIAFHSWHFHRFIHKNVNSYFQRTICCRLQNISVLLRIIVAQRTFQYDIISNEAFSREIRAEFSCQSTYVNQYKFQEKI